MTLKSYLWVMRIGALLSLASWILVVTHIDPIEAGVAGRLLFYGSFFLSVGAIAIIALTWLRRQSSKQDDLEMVYISGSFRQGILVSLLAVSLLVLQSFRILVWWDGLLVVAGICLIELYFLSRR